MAGETRFSKLQTAYLGLGGNIGDVADAMSRALQLLDAMPEIVVRSVSPVYKTPPWGVTDQPWFLNCCAELETSLAAEQLLDRCLDTEKALHRVREKRWGPRTIDIDVLTVDDVVCATDRLILPHPRMLDRAFVLLPLMDIAPQLAIEGKTVTDWYAALPSEDIELAIAGGDWWRVKGA